jgi:ribosome-binding ATPase YchF (GTP1/OBG family)
VRCFESADVHHLSGGVDPVRDIEIVNTELMLADLDSVRKRRERLAKEIKRGEKAAAGEDAVLARIESALDAGKPALTVTLSPEERALSQPLFLLTDKPTIFACNVEETGPAAADANPYVLRVRGKCAPTWPARPSSSARRSRATSWISHPTKRRRSSRISAWRRAAWVR